MGVNFQAHYKHAAILTLLLIHATGVSAYLCSRGSASTPSIDAEVIVYDHDSTSFDNYKNGDLLLIFTNYTYDVRSVGDPAYGGFTVALTSIRTDWSVTWSGTIILPSGGLVDNYGRVASWSTTFDNFAGTGEAAIATIWLPISQEGNVKAGSSITIFIDVPSAAQTATGIDYWDEKNLMEIIISGRDFIGLTGYSSVGFSGVEADSALDIQAAVLDPNTKLEAEGLTQKDRVTIRGVASEPGATVNIYKDFDGDLIGSAIADNTTGAFEIVIKLDREADSKLYKTNHIFVEGIDNAGNSTGKIFLRSITVTPVPSPSNWLVIVGAVVALIVAAGIYLFLSKRKR